MQGKGNVKLEEDNKIEAHVLWLQSHTPLSLVPNTEQHMVAREIA